MAACTQRQRNPVLPFPLIPFPRWSMVLAAEVLTGGCKWESASGLPPTLPRSGSATTAWGAKRGRSPRAAQWSILQAPGTSCSDHQCQPLGLVTLGKGTRHQYGARKGRGKCTALALESRICWADEWWWPFCMQWVFSAASVVLGTQIFCSCVSAKSVTAYGSWAGVFWLKRQHLMSA